MLRWWKQNSVVLLFLTILLFPLWANLSILLLFLIFIFSLCFRFFTDQELKKYRKTYFVIMSVYSLGFVLYEYSFVQKAPLVVLSWNAGMMVASALLLVLPSRPMKSSDIGAWSGIAIATISSFGYILIYNCEFLSSFSVHSTIFQKQNCAAPALRFLSRNSLMVASMILVISHLSLLNSGTFLRKLLGILGYIVGFFVLVFELDSRGGALAFILMSPIAFEYLRRREALGARNAYLAFCSFLVAIVYFTVTLMPVEKLERFQGAYRQVLNFDTSIEIDGSAYARVVTYEAALDAIWEAPLRGYGMSNRWNALEPHIDTYSNENGHSNNVILNHLLSAGVWGVVILIFLVLFPLYTKIRLPQKNRDEIFVSLVVAASLFGNGMTTAIFGHYMHSTFWACCLVFSLLIEFKSDGEISNLNQYN